MRAILPPDVETRLVREFFGGVPGYFVDVGANDPQLYSQTWHLEQAGWTGILIEPQPDLAAALERARKAKVFAVACSSPRHAGESLPFHVAGPYSSFNADLKVAGRRADAIIAVPVRTLDDILREAKAPIPLDFLSIDVEGHEVEVLAGLDLARWRPRLILIEDHVMHLRLHCALRSRGYKWVRRTGLNAWYVPVHTPMQVGLHGRLQFIRKYYLGLPFRRLRDAGRRLRVRLARRGAA